MSNLKPSDFYVSMIHEEDDVVFGFTSKDYWDERACLDDCLDDVPGLPDGFHNSMEAIWEYTGDPDTGMQLLMEAGFCRNLEMDAFLNPVFED